MDISVAFAVLLAGFGAASDALDGTSPDSLSRAQGWLEYSSSDVRELWKGYGQELFPTKGWTLADGELAQTGPGGGDLVTRRDFGDLEFQAEFKLERGANSGIMVRVQPGRDATWVTGPEYQLIDHRGYAEPLSPGQMTGSLYGLFPTRDAELLKTAGEWNHARIRWRHGVVQHWLNGQRIVESRVFDEQGQPTPEWLALIAQTKFKDMPGFGLASKGAIALQDHGGGVAFRNIRIRDLDERLLGEIALFNGRDLTGWTPYLFDDNTPDQHAKTWRVEDGLLICSGSPAGYIKTSQTYTNFALRLQWRFSPITKQAGNSGVLVRVTGEDQPAWPRSIEAQLQSGTAGDFWNIGEFPMKAASERTKGRRTGRLISNGQPDAGVERPIGEWNEYEILVDRGEVVLRVNGEEVNRATEAEVIAGHIALQSEGGEIHFREIRLIQLD
jgi:Domain of Unknown Function (DUF1080)